MRILLDECMPAPIIDRLADLAHEIHHAPRQGFAGIANGDLIERAAGRYDLFVTNDRHFRSPTRYPLHDTLGIVFVRIAPCITSLVAPALRALLTGVSGAELIGRRVILRREGWKFMD